MRRSEHRSEPRGLADLLLPFALVDNGILLQQDGSLVAGWSFRGPDMMAASASEMSALSARLNQVLRFGSGWMVHCDAVRSQAPEYPNEGHFPDPVTQLIDDERRQQFLAEGVHYESEYFLLLTYLPPMAVEETTKGWLFEGGAARRAQPAAKYVLEHFQNRIDHFENVFGSLFRIQRLGALSMSDQQGQSRTYDTLLRYWSRCIVGTDYPFALPEIPCYLNETLASDDFVGGTEPRIGQKHIRVIAIDGFPRLSSPGILRELDTLPLEYRWNTRAILIDAEESGAILDKHRRKWKSKIRGWKDQMLRSSSGAVNANARDMMDDAEQAMSIAASAEVQFCQFSANIILFDENFDRLCVNSRSVIKTIQNLGFSCRIETINAVEAWRGTIPGDGYSNVRRVLLHTLNLADMLPITSVWAGLRENPSTLMPDGSPPLLYAATTGSTPFRLNLHVSDVGHTLIIGPSGNGKSTLLSLLAAQWFRYRNAQVFAFDKGYSIWMLTSAANGEFYDLAGPSNEQSFCPLNAIDDDASLSWAIGWIESLCVLNGLKIIPRHRNALSAAMRQLRHSPTRTLTEFVANVQDLEIREALQYFTVAGPLGSLLDAEEDSLGNGRLLSFETENLLQLDHRAVVPVLLYLFRRIEQRLDGSPTLILLDEAWSYLQHQLFRERLRDWLKTMRRRNAAVVMATQQMSDIAKSDIADIVLENCPTKILLPNAEARTSQSRFFYERVGLNERELEILELGIPKKQYYVVNASGRRLIDLGIGDVALAWVGVNGSEERQKARLVMDRNPATWRSDWLRLKGLGAWADYLDEIQTGEENQSSCAEA